MTMKAVCTTTMRSGWKSWLPKSHTASTGITALRTNADAHLKRTVMGREVVVAVTGGRLDFGTWEQIFYFEFDGKRDKRALIKIIGE